MKCRSRRYLLVLAFTPLMHQYLEPPPESPAREIVDRAIHGDPILNREGRRISVTPSLSFSEGSITVKMRY